MTPLDLVTAARQQYNAVSDSFFSDGELYRHVWFAQDVLSKECNAIENTYTTSTVASQQEYTYPTTAIAIKRVTYAGKRLTRIKIKDDDLLTGFNAATTSSGTPTHYFVFDKVIYLRPIPAAVGTLKIFSFDQPSEVSATSTLDVPTEFHLDLITFLLWRMAAKDQNYQGAEYYERQWKEAVERCKRWNRKRQLADGFNIVRDEDAVLDAMEVVL